MGSINVHNGFLPYKDFHWVITPFTLYTQAFLQHLFWFVSPLIISAVWKGMIFSVLSFTSLVFISKINFEIGTMKQFPVPLLYLFPLAFFLVGPINETYVGYTSDAIFFASIGVILILWPTCGKTDFIKNRTVHFIGYFLLGLSFCYKQEIGIVSIIGGVFFILTKYCIISKRGQEGDIFHLLFIPLTLVFLPTCGLFFYFYSIGQLDLFINSIFIIPAEIKSNSIQALASLLTFGVGVDIVKIIILLYISLMTIVIIYLINSKNQTNVTVNQILNNIHPKLSKTIFLFLSFILIMISSIQLIPENSMLYHAFSKAPHSRVDKLILYVTSGLYGSIYFISIYTILSLFVFSFLKLLKSQKMLSAAFLRYIFGVILLLIVFDGAAIAGIDVIRGARIITPFLILTTMVFVAYAGSSFNYLNISYKNLYWGLFALIIFFFFVRIGNSGFSAVISDPFHNQIKYSPRLKCFVDKRVLHSMETMKMLIEKQAKSSVFIYQNESLLYYYFEKKPPTYSIVHYSDFYPHSLDSIEIKNLIDVRFIITLTNHKIEDSFLFRKDDPIRDYLEKNFRIIYLDAYYSLWEKI